MEEIKVVDVIEQVKIVDVVEEIAKVMEIPENILKNHEQKQKLNF